MRRKNRMARLFRALSGETQKDFARKTDIHPALLARYELDFADPSADHLTRLGWGAGLTIADGDKLLDLADTLREPRKRTGQGIEGLAENFAREIASLFTVFYQDVLRLPLSDLPVDDWQTADELWERLEDLPEDQQLAVVRVAREFQNQALAERIREESRAQDSRGPERAASLARLAQEIEERVQGPSEGDRPSRPCL